VRQGSLIEANLMNGHRLSAAERMGVDTQSDELLRALPTAIYRTDAEGRITFYNDAAAALWGCRPELGESEFCGSWKLYWPDGSPLPHDECPMAIALKEKRAIRGMEAIAERPDGTRIPFLAYPTPLFDENGDLIGAVNLLADIETSRQVEQASRHYAAIIESSEDAILAKDLNGVIQSWNRGAERLFGYTAEEAIGQLVTLLIPADRCNEEPMILDCIRRGERIEHYETVRQRKDGTLIDISLTVSPIRGRGGKIIGASKIARDITDRKRAQEWRDLMLREMNHRIKNLFAISNSVVSLSAYSAKTPKEMAASVGERLSALSRAHALTLWRDPGAALGVDRPTTLHALVRTVLSPYDHLAGNGARVTISGPDIILSFAAVTSLALLLQEFATNAAKYGAMSSPSGTVDVATFQEDDKFVLTWTERGGPAVTEPEELHGFGSLLSRMMIAGHLDGKISRDWRPEGLAIRLSMSAAGLSE